MLYKKLLVMAFVFSGLVEEAVAQDPDDKSNNAWISISGWVISADENSFVLDYGKNTVVVELKDWEWYSDNFGVVEDFRVTVYGRIDDSMIETTTIEPISVYVEDMGTYFHVGSTDKKEEANFYDWVTPPDVKVGQVTITGTVTKVNGRRFSIARGKKEIVVDTGSMDYNPMDDKGFQRVEKGDVVKVSGQLEADSFKNRGIVADEITSIEDANRKQ